MFILLKGPPGSGKSTIIKSLRQIGYIAIDLEKTGHSKEERSRVASEIFERYKNLDVNLYIGMADVSISEFPENSKSVLLLPPELTYLARVKRRDEMNPHKKFQNAEQVYANLKLLRDKYDHVFENELDVLDVVNKLLAL